MSFSLDFAELRSVSTTPPQAVNMPFINTPDLQRLNWPESRYMRFEDAWEVLERINKINVIQALIHSSCKSC